jgi:hypothetical protein
LPIQAEHFGEQIETAEHSTCHVAGGHHLLPPVVQRRQQLDTGVAASGFGSIASHGWRCPARTLA